MRPDPSQESGSTLREYLRILRRRKLALILGVVVVPAAAVVVSLQQAPLYEASADVFVKRQTLAATLSGIPEPWEDPERFVQTQVGLARVPELAQRVVDRSRVLGLSGKDLLSRSTVTANPGSDLLVFTVEDAEPERAMRLATAYAREFTLYRQELDTRAVRQARREIEQQIKQLGAAPPRRSLIAQAYAGLLERRGQLQTMEALQASTASLVHLADQAHKIQPRPIRNGILGLGLGIFFGLGVAFLWHALDTRIHSADEIGGRLGLTMLGRVPVPPRRLRRGVDIAMVSEPNGSVAEAFRMLRTNVDFANLERSARSIMFTSALAGEGKSTTVVNLGVAFALTGRRVVVVDLDLRRPHLHRFFDLGDVAGLTDVALGYADLDDAIVPIAFPALDFTHGEANGRGAVAGSLDVVTSGPVPPDPGEFVGSGVLDEILADLRTRAELVLIDSPPLLQVGDAMVLSAKVDALVLITRVNFLRRGMIQELQRVLATSPATKLGFVLTGVRGGDEYGGYYPYAYRHPEAGTRRERVA